MGKRLWALNAGADVAWWWNSCQRRFKISSCLCSPSEFFTLVNLLLQPAENTSFVFGTSLMARVLACVRVSPVGPCPSQAYFYRLAVAWFGWGIFILYLYYSKAQCFLVADHSVCVCVCLFVTCLFIFCCWINCFVCVFIGAGESGKSTIVKQMK